MDITFPILLINYLIKLIYIDRIDEREVQVSSAETDDEDLGDYLVPIGSTATIACEVKFILLIFNLIISFFKFNFFYYKFNNNK